jgi:hypothetical protein
MSDSVRDRVSHYRAKMRRAGLRPIQIWVPDTRQSGFAAECRRQSAMLADDPQETELADWLDQAADDQDWK